MNNDKYTIKLSLFVFFFIFLFSCIEKKDNGHYQTYIDPTISKFFNYKVGTYWLYKDSVTGLVDSFVIVSQYDETTFPQSIFQAGLLNQLYTYQKGIYDTIGAQWILYNNYIKYIDRIRIY